MAHRDVIHTFEALLRARAKSQTDVQVAQRLKRRRTIVDKLSRYPKMKLSRMDDVAGCRVIFPNVESLHKFRDNVHRARFKHVLKNEKKKYDYIEKPTERGYRGIHDIYEYHGNRPKCNGLLIEIQYRTTVQHAWATAVEVVTQVTQNEPKFNRGDPRYIRLFCLASEMLSRTQEGMTGQLPDIDDKNLVDEFEDLEKEIGVMNILVNLAIHEWVGARAKADHIILHISESRKFELHQFDLELEASKKLLELEKEFPEDDIVLVGARTVEEITSAFRNYFNDVREFMLLMRDASHKLGSALAAGA